MSATIKSMIAEGAETLAAAGVNEPRSEAGLLLMHVLQRDRAFLIAHPEQVLSADRHQQFRSSISRRAEGEPLQYITGQQEFFKLDFEVTPEVLIPRPETESIVEVGMEILRHELAPRFADIATGSGCIAISLLNELPQAHALATDVSSAALAVAKRNAKRHRVNERLRLIESDLFCAMDSSDQFEAIFSNPPYVPANELRALQREVRHEPLAALDGGPDGLAIIRRLLKDAPGFLRAGGHLVFEIGFGQDEMIKQLIDPSVWEFFGLRRDLHGIPRTVVLKKNVHALVRTPPACSA